MSLAFASAARSSLSTECKAGIYAILAVLCPISYISYALLNTYHTLSQLPPHHQASWVTSGCPLYTSVAHLSDDLYTTYLLLVLDDLRSNLSSCNLRAAEYLFLSLFLACIYFFFGFISVMLWLHWNLLLSCFHCESYFR